MSVKISERAWKTALTSIVEQLDEQEYKKMLFCFCFDKIPKSMKTSKSREEMPQTIIQILGVDESISATNEAMMLIPRKDSAVQDELRPFVDKLSIKQEEESKGKKRKHESDQNSADKEPKTKPKFKKNNVVSDSDSSDEEQNVAAGFKKNKVESDADSSDEKENVAADQPKSSQPDTERKIPSWRKSIEDVLTSGGLGNKVIIGKVVQKSALRPYQTKDKIKRFFFYLGVSDETSCIKVMVYNGKDRYEEFQEQSFYTFRNVIMDEHVMKVTTVSTVSKTKPIDVPEELEMEAEMLIYPQKPVCCIAKAKVYADSTLVSVEGTVTEIGPVERVKVKNQRRKKENKEKKDFHLKDDTGSIRITLWGKDVAQIRGISNGDFVRVTNVKTNRYYETVSLNSTDYTRICKIQSAAIQNVEAEIIGIISASMTETRLEASFNDEVETLVVASKLLAKVFEVRLEGDLKDRFIEKIPFKANVEIKGSQINKIKASKEM